MPKNSEKISVGFLFDDSLDSNDGVAQYVKALGARFSANGHNVTYLVGQSQTKSWASGQVISLSKNINVKFNGNRLSMPIYSSKKQIKKVLQENHFDVVHVQVPYSPLMAAKVIKQLPASTVVVGTFHIFPSGFVSRVGSRLLRVVLRPSIKRFDRMLSVSLPAQDFAAKDYKLKSQISPNVVSVKGFENSTQTKKDTIVFLGRLVPRKGCLHLIKAFETLKKDMPDAKLIIGGKGPQQKQLQNYVKSKNIDGVSFAGFVAEEDKPAFLAQASVACFPSLGGESFGIVLTEAMAAGAGVVLGGDNPGYRSVLGEKKELLIDPHNTPEFAARLKLLLTNDNLASELHAWQTSSVKQYDVGKVGAELIQLYRELIDIKVKNEHN